jgi:hypothetical protein
MTNRYVPRLAFAIAAIGLALGPSTGVADIPPTPARRAAIHATFQRWIVEAGHACAAVVSTRRVGHQEVGLPRDVGVRVFAVDCGGHGYYVYTEHMKPGHWIEPMKAGARPAP